MYIGEHSTLQILVIKSFLGVKLNNMGYCSLESLTCKFCFPFYMLTSLKMKPRLAGYCHQKFISQIGLCMKKAVLG